jgi:hypothetical protein
MAGVRDSKQANRRRIEIAVRRRVTRTSVVEKDHGVNTGIDTQPHERKKVAYGQVLNLKV